MTRVKVCGITNLEDALCAVRLGASALGFIFYEKSPRFITPREAGEVIRQIPPFVTKVGVFVNAEAASLREAKEVAGFDVYQFHGDETPGFCAAFGEGYIKVIRVKNAGSLDTIDLYDTDAFLFDTYSPDAYGGTGENFSWDVLARRKLEDKFVILSGGLNPDNVRDAIRAVGPYAVDVSSGVESSPGIKDHTKLERFMEAVSDGQN
ncbi:MAG: phosphoribosylanthranilate isomerase [Candidatus Dadabacteria bacterium]|nr:phosphoribosylanthranilate isomerase [Candidatus Dadabacteria bacterium]MYA48560.1 phosphoribosylanthranilate isomerase [Candidatus Dadabacteria bacterium]MYF48417.1 phosphoribosylanthranilate isomerase [Candidatus Dadabacteria bacterium]MYG83395.1 phosphoribosylanthranilate isomerase [Candidatus Dadabacteria bacterium]MYH39418.1 phosphoribosylanthranilate isomerase [Candidatus Dadabacteria bacterium]